MFNNHNIHNFRGSTFQNFMPPMCVPPPPLPPPVPFFLPVNAPSDTLDQEYVKKFENIAPNITKTKKTKLTSISEVHDKLRDLAVTLNELKRQEKLLKDKVNSSTEEEWRDATDKVNRNRKIINDLLSDVNASNLDALKKLLAERTAKRIRMKRLRIEKKRAKAEKIRELEEKSRKIDENLQKIKDAIKKAEQEKESKLQADMVLKEVLRKKHNAKKFVSKLDALKKLRHARLKTAMGKGQSVSTKESEEFDARIEKLKLLWAQKLNVYEREEEELRAKLKQDNNTENAGENEMVKQIASNLKKWRKVLFGDSTAIPQINFDGNVARFVEVRCHWDQYIDERGTSLPVGWVTPS